MTTAHTVVLLVDDLSEWTGTEVHLFRLLQQLDPARVRPVVAVVGRHDLADDFRARGIQVEPLQIYRTLAPSGLVGLGKIAALLRREHASLLVTYHTAADLLGPSAGRLAGVPVLSCRRDEGFTKKPIHVRLQRPLNRLLRGMISVSHKVVRAVQESEGYPPHRVQVIWNGEDLEKFAPGPSPVREELGLSPGACRRCRGSSRLGTGRPTASPADLPDQIPVPTGFRGSKAPTPSMAPPKARSYTSGIRAKGRGLPGWIPMAPEYHCRSPKTRTTLPRPATMTATSSRSTGRPPGATASPVSTTSVPGLARCTSPATSRLELPGSPRYWSATTTGTCSTAGRGCGSRVKVALSTTNSVSMPPASGMTDRWGSKGVSLSSCSMPRLPVHAAHHLTMVHWPPTRAMYTGMPKPVPEGLCRARMACW